ncbi:MAG TPA: hypothetical protein DCR81_07965, partial [Smithella sp.]|nr:hypothetical protein [Smithella sp.]
SGVCRMRRNDKRFEFTRCPGIIRFSLLAGIPEHAPGFPAGLHGRAVGGHKPFKETFNLG